MGHLRRLVEGGVKVLAFLALFALTLTAFGADEKPLTEDQIKQLINGPLKTYPDEVTNLVKTHGVSFFPTNTTLGKLKDAGVPDSVISVIRSTAAQQMRIKVCLFKSSDGALANEFAHEMVERLFGAKGVDIDPFGHIPVDDEIGRPEGFDNNVSPDAKNVIPKPNILYILIEGSIQGDSSPHSLQPHVLYRDIEGRQYSLPGAPNAPSTLERRTVTDTANRTVDWAIETARLYATSGKF